MKFGILTAAIAVLFWTPSVAQEQESAPASPRPAKVFTVEETSAEITRLYPAVVLPSREVEVSFRVSGQVIELPIRAASQVQEGDVIAQIDPRDFESQVAQLQSQRDQAQAQLDALRAGARAEEIIALEAAVESAQAQLTRAEDTLNRTQSLFDRGVSTNAQLEVAQADFDVARANVRAQQEQLEIGLAGGRAEDIAASEAVVRGLDAQLQAAKDNLADTTLRAPFSGIIARRDIDNFRNVQAGQSVVLLQAISTVHLSFDIPGPDVTLLGAEGPAVVRNTVTFDALPGDVFDAEVVEFSVQADQASLTYRGRVAVASPDTTMILPGMVAEVTASIPGPAPVLLAPLTAIAAGPDGTPFVWRVGADNAVSQQTVMLGEATGAMVEITEGLASGDTIISAGVSQIFAGMTVRPITQVGN